MPLKGFRYKWKVASFCQNTNLFNYYCIREGLKKKSFSAKKNMVSKCIKSPKYSFKSNLFSAAKAAQGVQMSVRSSVRPSGYFNFDSL